MNRWLLQQQRRALLPPSLQRAVLPPGNWGERVAQGGVVIRKSLTPLAVTFTDTNARLIHSIFANQDKVTLSKTIGDEAAKLTREFYEVFRTFYENVSLTNVVEWSSLNDRSSGSDPFDYTERPNVRLNTSRKINCLIRQNQCQLLTIELGIWTKVDGSTLVQATANASRFPWFEKHSPSQIMTEAFH